mmetsp:Transcript_20957/g.60515  ORF Transcript_20957/g.60515 Transcript_20957/m.60515 type:complete len:243 (+) Transcript_20957:125-853(+)
MFGCGCCKAEGEPETQDADDVSRTTDDSKPVQPTQLSKPAQPEAEAVAAVGPEKPAAAEAVMKKQSSKTSKSKDGTRSAAPAPKRLIVPEAPDKQAAKHHKAGDEAFARQEWQSAIEAYSKAIELNPSCAASWAGRGGVKVRSGNPHGALPDLDEALRLDADHLFARRDRAEARSKCGDCQGALADFDHKLSLAPADGRALLGRGELRLKRGDKEGAIADFSLASRLSYPHASEWLQKARQN